MSIDQAKLDRIKASLASDAKAEGVTPGPWVWSPARTIQHLYGNGNSVSQITMPKPHRANEFFHRYSLDAAFIARARTTAPAMAKLLLDEILWLEQTWNSHCYNRLARLVNGWPEETL